MWESIPTLGISKRTNSQNWEQTFQSIPTSVNAQIPYGDDLYFIPNKYIMTRVLYDSGQICDLKTC